ncbi:carboxypeptidase-like regulatory domain-containing protein [Hymenobacter antarcticus]|uniref:carboxypeptidase-like regulatory domain-containing protein n=1 Tax=Hymenobacter antarcticus TaxID=486270 RepID=UPI0031F11579
MKTTLRYRCLLGLCWALVLLNGCGKKTRDPAPTTGIAGTVKVTDQSTRVLPKNGVTVTVLNTSPLLTATTNAAGEFIIGAVPAGTYTLEFTKAGLSTFVLRSVAHPQAEVLTQLPETYTLVLEPTIRATDLQATNIMATAGGATVPAVRFLTTRTTPQPEFDHSYVLYFGTQPDVSYRTAPGFLILYSGGSQTAAVRTSSWTLDRSEFLARGFSAASGTTAYAVAYGIGQGSAYRDLVTGRQLTWPNPNLTPSAVVSFTMP